MATATTMTMLALLSGQAKLASAAPRLAFDCAAVTHSSMRRFETDQPEQRARNGVDSQPGVLRQQRQRHGGARQVFAKVGNENAQVRAPRPGCRQS